MMEADLRIDILRQKLATADIPPAERDALADDLEFAQTINGDPDDTRQMMKRSLISGVRREMLAYDRHAKSRRDLEEVVKRAMDTHTKNCPFSAPAKKAKEKDADGTSRIRLGRLLDASGDAAKIVAAVLTLCALVVIYATWQNVKTRALIKQGFERAVEEAAAAAD